jgi:hypothetical protein
MYLINTIMHCINKYTEYLVHKNGCVPVSASTLGVVLCENSRFLNLCLAKLPVSVYNIKFGLSVFFSYSCVISPPLALIIESRPTEQCLWLQ